MTVVQRRGGGMGRGRRRLAMGWSVVGGDRGEDAQSAISRGTAGRSSGSSRRNQTHARPCPGRRGGGGADVGAASAAVPWGKRPSPAAARSAAPGCLGQQQLGRVLPSSSLHRSQAGVLHRLRKREISCKTRVPEGRAWAPWPISGSSRIASSSSSPSSSIASSIPVFFLPR